MTQTIENRNNICVMVLSNMPSVPIRPRNKKKKFAISEIINSHTSKTMNIENCVKTSIQQNRMVTIPGDKFCQGSPVVTVTIRNNFIITYL